MWSTLSSNYTVEVLAGAGFDWMVLDTEHSPADLENLLGQLQAVAPYPTTPVVRVPWNDMVNIKRVLDIGAQSLLIPQINTEQEARDAVSFTGYPPAGLRGVAGATRGTRFGRIKNYFKTAHEESASSSSSNRAKRSTIWRRSPRSTAWTGFSSAPPICTLRSAIPANARTRRRSADHREGDQAILKAGKIAGILTDESMAPHWIDAGATFVGMGSDVGILARGVEAMAAKFKS